MPPQPRRKSWLPRWAILALLVILITEGLFTAPVYGLGIIRHITRFAEGVGQGGGGNADQGEQGLCPQNQLQVIRNNRTILNKMSRNIPTYRLAAEENNIPWEMLAALHYREHNNDASAPSNGEGPYQMTDYSIRLQRQASITVNYRRNQEWHITRADLEDFTSASKLAANYLQHKTNFTISETPSDDKVKDAFWGYNGRAFGSADNSFYVMNNFDENHYRMRIRGTVNNGQTRVDTIDTRDGAYVVYYLLKYLAIYDGNNIIGFKDCTKPATNPGGDDTSAGDGSYIRVPAVSERTKGDCGQASVLMVALFINPRHRDAQFLERDSSGRYWTRDDLACVSAEYLNRVEGSTNDWVRDNPIPSVGIERIKRSLEGGDPVVFFGTRGLVYDNTQHIFVITGYDPSDDSFYVNNPYIISGVGGCECDPSTKLPNGKRITPERLSQHFGGRAGIYRSSLILRSRYR